MSDFADYFLQVQDCSALVLEFLLHSFHSLT
nr:MAG TPA: hypothetical protein [Caudoviricetes sp.]